MVKVESLCVEEKVTLTTHEPFTIPSHFFIFRIPTIIKKNMFTIYSVLYWTPQCVILLTELYGDESY